MLVDTCNEFVCELKDRCGGPSLPVKAKACIKNILKNKNHNHKHQHHGGHHHGGPRRGCGGGKTEEPTTPPPTTVPGETPENPF